MRKLRNRTLAMLALACGTLSASAVVANESGLTDAEALLITSGDPSDPTYANAGGNLRTGVGSIFTVFESTAPSGFLCTASAISDNHLLTAAHCVRNTAPDGSPDPLTRVVVILPSGVFYLLFSENGEVTGFNVHPLYDATNPDFGAFAAGDVAVIELGVDLPADVERYDLYRDADEFGLETRHYGHGRSGTGNKGATGGADFFFARTGLNRYEQTLGAFFGPPFDQLLHDFDSGGNKHNAMDWWFSPGFSNGGNPNNPPWAQDGQSTTIRAGLYPDKKGFGKLEVGIAPGDSGGPGFIDGKIAGVHSFGFTHFCAGITNGTDFSCGLNSSYGEMSGDTRVSTFADWIDDVVAGAIESTPIPEPAPEEGGEGGTSVDVAELGAYGKSFLENTFSQTMRQPMTIEEALEVVGKK